MSLDISNYPRLKREKYSTTSGETTQYNCIAWAAGDDSAWWDPSPGFYNYWPRAVPRAVTLDAISQLFEWLGYVICDDDSFESGYEKVILYAHNGVPTHAARQLEDGTWTSKLGNNIDITHKFSDSLEGPSYGIVERIFKRQKS